MQIKCLQPILGLNGQPIKDATGKEITIGFVLSNILLMAKSSRWSKAQIFSMSMKFFNDRLVDVDNANLIDIKKMVEDDESFDSAIFAGRTLEYLSGLKTGKEE